MGRWTRRDFLRRTCCTAAAGMAAMNFNRFGVVNALAQTTTDYKALVCVFLFGGNDSNNMVIPISSSGYASYQKGRSLLALPQNQLLPINPPSAGASFGFHPRFKNLQALFNSQQAAVLANVGTLLQPTTAAQFQQGQATVPMNLFSHSDQQTQMQTASFDQVGNTGWAGRVADNLQSVYPANFPTVISLAGSNIFCEGIQVRAIEASGSPTAPLNGFYGSNDDNNRLAALQSLLTFDTGLSLIQAASTTTTNAIQDSKTLAAALATGKPLVTQFPANSYLSSQLQQVAQIIAVRGALGIQRQIFFVQLDGFDTHSDQLPTQDALYADLDGSLGAFFQATNELGVQSQVTTFTLSDFSRTFEPDSTSGSDHAWGGHHLIMGAGLAGGDFYGTFPNLALGGPDDATGQGRWVPTTSLDQYAATLAQWFGVAATDLPTIFPNLGNFTSPTLNFFPASSNGNSKVNRMRIG
jgi:uncharacterized protein (DUF1501 family)